MFSPQCENFMKFLLFRILREINFGDFRSAKLAVLTAFRGAEFGFFMNFALFESRNIPN